MTIALIRNSSPIWNSALPTPTELRLSKDKKTLTVSFDSGGRYEISAELLRVESPSAEVQGHDPSQKKIIPGKRNVEIINMEPVGNYAVRIVFDDMHDTGIYSWDILYRLGRDGEKLMKTYRSKLAEQGLSS
ncbi:MAG: gamma-butyrobetaine hydroxylase-like domain-containing protein [Rhizobiaceae bacterium]